MREWLARPGIQWKCGWQAKLLFMHIDLLVYIYLEKNNLHTFFILKFYKPTCLYVCEKVNVVIYKSKIN